MIRKGNRPNLIIQSTELKDVHAVWCLMLVFRDLETDADPDGRYARLAARYKMELDELQEQVHFQYSTTDEHIPDQKKRTGEPTTFLAVSGYRGWR